jgi:catechol 2,3-dioxygenase-like lactoylglutathione lyase family enzyme
MSNYVPKFGWGHININVDNLETSVEFYEKLGFELFIPGIPYLGLNNQADGAELPDAGARALGLQAATVGRACIMQLNRGFPKLDLTELNGQEKQKPLTNADLGLVRICLASQNLQEDYQQLSARGVVFLTPPQPGKDGLADIATCVDPDGTLIELLQVYLDKWPK